MPKKQPKSKRKEAPKTGRNPIPIPPRRSFVGALAFDPKRKQEETVFEILRVCLQGSRSSQPINSTDVTKLCKSAKITELELIRLASSSWLVNPTLADALQIVLQVAGYGGNIDELWSTVYNTVKPSFRATRVARQQREAQGNAAWVYFVHTGQTRKPGSHRS